MAVIGELVTNVTARTTQFERGMDKSRGKLRQFETRTKVTTKSVVALNSAFSTLGLSVIGFGAALHKVSERLQEIDKLGKTATKLGLATVDLQRLRFAAELTGNEVRNFDLGLQRMTRRIAEAAQGTGEAKAAIAELGLDAQRLAQMSPDQAFRKIAEAMKGIESQSDRVRLSFKLFDSEGVGLVNTLTADLKQLEKRFDATGAGIDENLVKKIEDANDSWTEFKTTLEGIGNKALPTIVKNMKSITDGLLAAERLFDRFTSGFSGGEDKGGGKPGAFRSALKLTLDPLSGFKVWDAILSKLNGGNQGGFPPDEVKQMLQTMRDNGATQREMRQFLERIEQQSGQQFDFNIVPLAP